jgi:hypothetical protein
MLAEPDPDGHSCVEAGVYFLTGVFYPVLESNSSSEESYSIVPGFFPVAEVNLASVRARTLSGNAPY